MACSPGCFLTRINNGVCDPFCHNDKCGFDGDDCVGAASSVTECAPGCSAIMINNGVCDPECDVHECGYDSQSCYVSSLAGGAPQAVDLEGCSPEKCLPHFLDDGYCQTECNVKECNWDFQDCVSRGSILGYLANAFMHVLISVDHHPFITASY